MAGPQKFSRYEMALEFERGATPKQLAMRYGVSVSAIYQARRSLDPEWAFRQREYHRRWQRDHHRSLCKGGCGALVWIHQPGRSGFCPRCVGERRATGVRPDELQCKRCEQWFPDDRFYRNAPTAVSRRGRDSYCRACASAARKDYRERHKIPCGVCGRPCLPPSEKGRRCLDRALCLDCYRSGKRPQ